MSTFFRVSIVGVIVLTVAMPALAQWTDGQDAVYVVGQPLLTTNGYGTSANAIWGPFAVAVDETNNKLWVSDTYNNRVLRFALPLSGHYPAAERVLGQANFNDRDPDRGTGVDANTLQSPHGLAVDATGRLWVADRGNHRVLRFDNAHSIATDGQAANGVLGQPNFTSEDANQGATTSGTGIDDPFDLAISASGALFVADAGNNRILRFDNAAALGDGVSASVVLGQPNFTSNSLAISQTGMNGPRGCYACGTTLFVADYSNNRVLRFDGATTMSNGAGAGGVLGQVDFVSGSPDRGGSAAANTLDLPYGVICDAAGRLYVADYSNNRGLMFDNASAKPDGANADNVIGQDTMTGELKNKNDSTNAVADGFYRNTKTAVNSLTDRIFVADTLNNRVLQFNASTDLPVKLIQLIIEE